MSIIPVPPDHRRNDFTLTMINIVFLLLLFFLTTGSLTNRQEAQSTVPVTRNLPLERLPRPLLLIEEDGSLFLDGAAVYRDEVGPAAKRALQTIGRDDAVLSLLAQRDMPARPLLNLVEQLRAEGLPLQLVTLRQPLDTGASAK
ncbi:biopolymer transporter ExbD [Pseudaminobacter sp. 19-2017]|uniref:Biopolymer transporter ExbD n=1 Tax=Pseudaminobacter soli (ex Zhang et al. 2022) TaxID=2831468 RepID=A0A942DYU2_9HYPH|nr:biopolymer transporter ExbD [Pseudaminobacter soli]MBS3650131.1 biopolymer transporter ExbD [Pseudaminobacter soli]